MLLLLRNDLLDGGCSSVKSLIRMWRRKSGKIFPARQNLSSSFSSFRCGFSTIKVSSWCGSSSSSSITSWSFKTSFHVFLNSERQTLIIQMRRWLCCFPNDELYLQSQTRQWSQNFRWLQPRTKLSNKSRALEWRAKNPIKILKFLFSLRVAIELF